MLRIGKDVVGRGHALKKIKLCYDKKKQKEIFTASGSASLVPAKNLPKA
jgi:hypothetical protein